MRPSIMEEGGYGSAWTPGEIRGFVRFLEQASRDEEYHQIRNSELISPVRAALIEGDQGTCLYRFQFAQRVEQFREREVVWMRRGDSITSGWIGSAWTASQGTVIEVKTTSMLDGECESWAFHRETGSLHQATRARLSALWPERPHPNRPFIPDDDLICHLLNGADVPRSKQIATPPLSHMNQGQADAVRAGVYGRITYLWGPAGTGKTATVAEIVRCVVQAGGTVLVLTYTNTAADIAAHRIASLLAEHDGFHHGLLLRIGNAGKDLQRRWGSRLLSRPIRRRLHAEADAPKGQRLVSAELQARGVALRSVRSVLGGTADARLRETLRQVTRNLERLERQARGEPIAVDPRWGEIRGASVVVTTLHQLALNSDLARKFDTVVIDEASQAPLPLAMVAAAHARDAIVIAGDPRQLATPIESNAPNVRRAYGSDLFHESGVLSSGSPALVRLREQYRMAPEISEFLSEVAYDDELYPAEQVVRRVASPIRREVGALRWLDTGAHNARTDRGLGGSRMNRTHVRVIADLIGDLHRRDILPKSAAVLSPYRAQVSALRRRVQGIPVDVATVHKYQGDEVDFVLFDLTDAPGLPASPFMLANFPREEGARLLTVGASRARECLIVVGDFQYIERRGGAAVQRFVRALRRHGRCLPTSFEAVG